MINWINGIAYMLSTICIVSLLFKYKNKFYLSQYLLKCFGNIKKLSIILGLISLSILIIYGLCANLPQYIVIFPFLFPAPNKLLSEIIKVLFNKIIEFIDIFWIVLITLFGMNLFNWFQKFSLILPVLFIQFLFVIYILFLLKIGLLIFAKCKGSYLFYLISFILSFIIVFSGILYHATKENKNAIRVTKGKLKDLGNKRSVELFLKDEQKSFPIKIDQNKVLYIENYSSFKDYEIQKTLINKDNDISIHYFDEKEKKVRKGEFIVINNENSNILNEKGERIKKKISIEGKIIILEKNKDDKNNYIFIGNNFSWNLLKDSKIEIKEDNFYLNLLNLILFLFSIIYFSLKLYGKKSKEYYDKGIINEIKDTPILFDRNKYDKFLTLSMFGLTIPNIWKIMSTRAIGDVNKSIWLKIGVLHVFIFSLVLFCLITSKEISECVKELENEKPKRKRKNWQTNLCKKKGE